MNSLRMRTGLALPVAMAVCTCALAQVSTTDPLLGYVCPAGGQQGTTAQIMVGGTRISRATDAVVSGRGFRRGCWRHSLPPGPRTRTSATQSAQR